MTNGTPAPTAAPPEPGWTSGHVSRLAGMELLFAGWFALAASWSGTKHAVMPVLAFVFVNVVVLVVPTR